MNRLLHNNPVAIGLLGLGGLALALLLLTSLWFLRPLPGEPDTVDELPPVANAAGEPIGSDSENLFTIVERPLFSADRRPIEPEQEAEDLAVEEEAPPPPPMELDAILTGVIITPERKLITLRTGQGGEIVRAEEGVPLEGPLDGWSVTDVSPRLVNFSANSGETAQLEMKVNRQALTAPQPPRRPRREEPLETMAADNEDGNGREAEQVEQPEEELSAEERAEELRRLIAERRERLREEAAQRREQQDQDIDQEN